MSEALETEIPTVLEGKNDAVEARGLDFLAATMFGLHPIAYLRNINNILALVDNKNYAQAAQRLGITQSALTQSILKLEKQLGLKLFERGRFGAMPTNAGKLLYEHSKRVAADTRVVFSELDSIKNGRAGDVSIGIGKSVTWQIVPQAIKRFQARHPNVHIQAYEGWSYDLFHRLQRGDFDFVVSASIPRDDLDPDLRQDYLFSQKVVIIASPDHPLGKRKKVALSELVDCHWVIPPPGTGSGDYIRRVFVNAELSPPNRFTRTDSMPLLMALVQGADTVGFASVGLVADFQTANELVVLPVNEFNAESKAFLTYRRRRLSPLAADLAKEIKIATKNRRTDSVF